MNGVLVINKAQGLTSHDVVNRVRRILGQRSVGHLGTLDPSATGVLPIVTGNLTRLAQFYLHADKSYEGVIRFGFSTDTYDAEGDPTSQPVEVNLELDELRTLASQFVGKIEQAPPPFSAKKISGTPAYKLARRKVPVELKPVEVEVKEFEIVSASDAEAAFRVSVGSGTYIRSLVHELGRRLGCGAHLASLRRTRVAEFRIEDSHALEVLEAAARQGTAATLFIHPRSLAPDLPSVTATEEVVAALRCGRSVNLPEFSQASLVKVFHGQSDLVAVVKRIAGTLFQPKVVFSVERRASDEKEA